MKPRQCPSCHGRGGEVDVIVDGQGPFEECGFCRGTGVIRSKKLFYQILGWESWDKRRRNHERMGGQRADGKTGE